MNVKFSKDELAMVYQYAAATKQETLAAVSYTHLTLPTICSV